MKKNIKELVLKKPNQTIMISNGDITATQRKAYNVLLYKASEELRNDVSKSEFLIAIIEIKKMAGIKATDNWHLKRDLKALKSIDIEIVKNNGNWVIFNLLSQAEKKGDFLLCEFPKIIRDALIQNDYYTTLNMMIIKTLTSKYSVILYETAMRYNKVEIPKFQINEFKKLTGTEKYKNFKDIRKRVIEPAIKEINEKSDIELSYKTFAAGRKVKEIKFKIKRKDQVIIDEKPINENISDLETELISLKISKRQADELVKKYSSDQIRRNINLTLEKAKTNEIRSIPGFLTDAIKNDYAKDYDPSAENNQKLVSEAKKCWKKTKGSCQADWNNYKGSKSHACHWCKKFADQRSRVESEVSEPEKLPVSPVPSDTNHNLCDLIPVKVTNPIRDLVEKYHKSHGPGHVRQSIETANRHVTDKRKYRALLEKSLAENQVSGVSVLGDEIEKILKNRKPKVKKKPGRKPSQKREDKFEKVRRFVEGLEADGMTPKEIEKLIPAGYRKDFEKLKSVEN